MQLRADHGLFAPNDDNFCFVCHAAPSASGVFPGNATWAQSAHGNGRELNRCANCHDAHGTRDNAGVVPSMLERREPELCVDCHDGARGPDIRNQLTKSYVHGGWSRGSHDPREEGDSVRFGVSNRHVSCSDCHNAHNVIRDPAPSSPDRTNRLAGASRVQVANGGAGVVPTYRFVAAGDPGDEQEYEICFKCHSSWTKQPVGQPDLARLTNPNNPSFHPIQAEGRNARIDPRAFVDGYDTRSVITCSDCHSSDDLSSRGPHGSSFRYLLRKSEDDLCFDCHTKAVYSDPSATIANASRFPAHLLHTTARVDCASCHDAHGSIRNAALILTGRFPGMSTYVQTPSGGTCTSSCHTPRTYTASYPR